MASRRIKLIAAASALVVGAGGYFLYSVMAVQGQGTLAQAPLNVQAQIPPAFIMAVDDSGSMTFETLFPGNNGQGHWNNATRATNGFYDASGNLNAAGDGLWAHVIPNGINIGAARLAIPPIDNFGFARSPETNPSYFDPGTTYTPWRRADGTSFPNADITAALSDPRDTGSVQIDMTSDRFDNNTGRFFQTRNGMVLPAGVSYYTTNSCGGLGTTGGTRNRWVPVLVAQPVTATCNIGISYFPATFYLGLTTPAPTGYKTTLALPPLIGGRTLAINACGAGCNMYRYEIKPFNYTSVADYNAAIQNFANWYSYYGNRNRAMIAGMTTSLVNVQNMRVGFFTINNRIASVPMRNMNVLADKNLLYNSLLGLPASGGTPNLFAVNHLGQQFQRTDAGAPVQLSCQKNAGMLFTDGFSNSGTPGAPAVTGLGYPFDPTPANSMAAIATRYYQTTLRTGPAFPAGKVPVPAACSASPPDPRLDCNANLHMNFYGVTLGAQGSIYDPNLNQDPFVDPPIAWPGHNNDSPTTVDDIWHASINTRGEFINARTPSDITAAMRRVLASVSAGSSPAGSIALTGARIGTGSLTVSPFYEARNSGTDWYSTLTAQTVTTNPATGVVSFTNAWEASARLPAAGSRNGVWFGTASGASQFTPANVGSLANLCNDPRPGMSLCTAGEIAALGGALTPITLTQAISYLKGDQSLEVDGAGNGALRFRTTRLGDIVNSTPVVSAPTDDYGYRSLPAPYGTSYNNYLNDAAPTGKRNRRPMVYAGANDGMLHAFDGRTGAAGGVERFAYIPQSVLGYMGNLLFPYDPANSGDQKFQHRYYVDGPIAVSDAYYGGGWKTVLVGTTGAGARGAFALNVSSASQTSGSFAASDRLWEINDSNTALPASVRNNIGHVLGRPVIVPVKTGSGAGPVRWRAIFGNGYNSASGKAVLFLVDIGTGAPNITMIEAVESGPGVPPGSNGLGNIVVTDRFAPNPFDSNNLTAPYRDGFADTVYAADQKGAIWKFDLRSATPANQATPLFTTLRYTSGPESGFRQPILGGLTAAAGPGGGVLVYFGTGSFSFEGDPVDDTLQSIYAVLDSSYGAPTAPANPLTRSNLLQQTITGDTGAIRTTSSNAMPVGRSGWYLDLPTGERAVGYPRIVNGVLFVPTYAPVSAAECSNDGVNWLYGLNALSGAASLSNVRFGSPTGTKADVGTGAISLDTQGTAPVKDVAVLTSPRVPPLAAGASAADLAAALAAQCSMVIQVAGAPPLYMPRACGRQSWRQIQ